MITIYPDYALASAVCRMHNDEAEPRCLVRVAKTTWLRTVSALLASVQCVALALFIGFVLDEIAPGYGIPEPYATRSLPYIFFGVLLAQVTGIVGWFAFKS